MLTILSFGGGQDSTAILYRIALDETFRKQYVRGRLLVIMSDTGDEHDATYQHVHFIEAFCQQHGIEFYFLRPEQGYHPRSWPGLIPWMKAKSGIMSKAYPKTCTDNLKIKPIYNFLDHFIGKEIYGVDLPVNESRKNFIKLYVRQHGRIRVILGIAKGEEKRLSQDFTTRWMRKCLVRVYPLVEEGLDRSGCQTWIRTSGLPLPPPSNCKRCPFLSEVELVWLYRFYPADYYEWVDMEHAKVEKWRLKGIPIDKNLGVHGRTMLPDALANALHKFGHLTDEDLQEYRMSHGHCVQSKF